MDRRRYGKVMQDMILRVTRQWQAVAVSRVPRFLSEPSLTDVSSPARAGVPRQARPWWVLRTRSSTARRRVRMFATE